MKAIEITSKTDKLGRLKIDYKLDQIDRKVRVLILLDDSEDMEDEWLYSISKNPVFDFLNEPEEDIYTLKDGKAFND